MILVISDVHGQFHVVNEQVSHAEDALSAKIDSVIVLGDLGLYESNLRKFFAREAQRFSKPLYFIEGNHEDFSQFDALLERYRDNFTHWPKGTVQNLCGIDFLCLGGARYMDLSNTPMNSEIRDGDIERCLSHRPDAAKVIITHDCPMEIGVPNTPGLEYYGPPGFARSGEILRRFTPKLWLFGHHHKWFSKTAGGTAFHGLPESWNGYGLLNDRLEFRPVASRIERKHEPFWKRWFGGL